MERAVMGNPVVYIVYDRNRSGTTTGWRQVVVFNHVVHAHEFLEEQDNEDYVLSCQSADARYLIIDSGFNCNLIKDTEVE